MNPQTAAVSTSSSGSLSLRGAMIFACVVVLGFCAFCIIGMVDIALEKRDLPTMLSVVFVSIATGWVVGAIQFSRRDQVFSISWSDDGFTYALGYRASPKFQHRWQELLTAALFVRERKKWIDFVLILELQSGVFTLDSRQFKWKKAHPFVEAVESHVSVARGELPEDFKIDFTAWRPNLPLQPRS